MKRRTEFYAAVASRRFLAGTSFHSPYEAVAAGVRSIEEWCDCLGQSRLEGDAPAAFAESDDMIMGRPVQRAADATSAGF